MFVGVLCESKAWRPDIPLDGRSHDRSAQAGIAEGVEDPGVVRLVRLLIDVDENVDVVCV